MQHFPFNRLACPIDLQPLALTGEGAGSSYLCARNHTFDVARAGYVNLLPAQFKHSKNPGDKKEMVSARSAFLNTGIYAFILEALINEVRAFIQKSHQNHFYLVDAGCGEGYYTAGLMNALTGTGIQKAPFSPEAVPVKGAFLQTQTPARQKCFSVLGYDISKEAVTAAAKRTKDITWAVATNTKIPVLNASADIVTCLFGFPAFGEFARVLKPGGALILIDAGPNHLLELRQRIYDTVIIKDASRKQTAPFECVKQVPCTRVAENLRPQQIDALLKMTPHYYRMQKDKYDALLKNPPPAVTLDVVLNVYAITP